MNINKKIIIISSGFPFGLKETFLYNEVLYLSKYFDVEIFPIIKGSNSDVPRPLPKNVSFHKPILKRSFLKRTFYGIFNLSPVLPFLMDLKEIVKSPNHLKNKITRWFLSFIVFRTLYSSSQFQTIKKSDSQVIYFYWGNTPIKMFDDLTKKIFIRVHGGEVDLARHFGYIPLKNYNIVRKDYIHYLVISCTAARNLISIKNVNFTINRLGVFEKSLCTNSPPMPQHIRIVSCSNLISLKRVHLIVDALFQIKTQKVQWIHFGDGPLFKDIQKLSLSLPSNVECLLKGRVKNEEVLQFYAKTYVDLFINVSETEGVPVSIMEAFSFGIPCFATDVGGTSEIVEDQNGYLASKDFDIRELSCFIENIREVSQRNNLRKNAKRTWAEKCSAEKNYKELVDLFES